MLNLSEIGGLFRREIKSPGEILESNMNSYTPLIKEGLADPRKTIHTIVNEISQTLGERHGNIRWSSNDITFISQDVNGNNTVRVKTGKWIPETQTVQAHILGVKGKKREMQLENIDPNQPYFVDYELSLPITH